ncbi:hypothetical protein MHC_03725 [Mycoplasma haemocanis str. Illinois]|uniref:Uncharacterized protein n=1 Tax=Mycoplasma haemocanis (strain Illinois) TaxID=1111676 RepID=H6N7I3_MYCHN|nr:hypothetical protein [Mycoplasma haemocanis]AEW45605.1 hypothetical protein MHC_03725 [Mycoplasma haemocanis str. Illinois]
MSSFTKLIFGSFGLGITGYGLSVEKTSSHVFRNEDSFTTITVKKECRIHKLITSEGPGKFERVEKEELEREIKKAGKGDWASIENACLANIGKDIFVSNPRGQGWKHIPNGPWTYSEPYKFQQYLNRLQSN